MRTDPPEGFNLPEFLEGIYTFQKWEIFPGQVTQGPKDVSEHLRRLNVPTTLAGLRVLDIAPWNGFFGFECVRRGAAEVVSLGPDDPDLTGYNKVRDLLQIDNCKYIRASVYDLSPDVHGTFDIVFFLGLIYHLRHPLLALDRIYRRRLRPAVRQLPDHQLGHLRQDALRRRAERFPHPGHVAATHADHLFLQRRRDRRRL